MHRYAAYKKFKAVENQGKYSEGFKNSLPD